MITEDCEFCLAASPMLPWPILSIGFTIANTVMNLRLLVLFCLSFAMSIQAWSQQLDSLAQQYLKQVNSLIKDHGFGQAYEQAKLALDIYEQRYAEEANWENLEPIFRFRERIATIQRRLGQYPDSEKTLAQMLVFARRKLVGQKDKLAWSYNLAGEHYAQWGQHSKTIECYLEAIALLEQLPKTFAQDLAYRYGALGSIYTLLKDYDKTVYYHLKGLALRRTYLPEVHLHIAWHYHQMGQAYDNLFKYQEARNYYDKALEIRVQLLGADHQYVGMIYNDLGVMEWRRANYEEALSNYDKALKIYQKSFGDKHIQVAKTLNNIGLSLSQSGEIKKAISYLERSLEIKKSILPNRHPELISTYNNLGLTLFTAGEETAATEHLNKALTLNVEGYQSHQKIDSSILDQPIASANALRSSLLYLAALRTYSSDSNLQTLREADIILQAATKMVDRDFQKYNFSNSRINLLSKAQEIYIAHIETLYQLHAITDDATYLERIYVVFERSRSVLLSKAINEAKITRANGVPQAMLDNLKSQRFELMNIEQLLATSEKNMSDTLVASMQERLVQLSESIEEQFEDLKKKHPRYYQHFHSFGMESLKAIQASLDPGQQLISFFKGFGFESVIYTLLINRSSFSVHKKLLPKSFFEEVEDFHQLLSQNDLGQSYFGEFCRQSHRFYQDLLQEPLEKTMKEQPQIKHLILIPNSNLSYLPFEALLTELPDTTTVDYRELPYLLQDFQISYAPSASLWLNLDQMRVRVEGQEHYVGFAPTYESSNEELAVKRGIGLGDLAFSKTEVANANAIFGGTAYLDEEATKEKFISMAAAPAILHLAMHASVNDKIPLNSSLWFNSETDSSGHAPLSAAEIYGLSLPTQLSVLSACQTGYGRISNGEGVFSLSRAFMYAGSPSLLTSLWDSNDKFTTELMNLFFTRIKAGEGKHLALQQAKLDYLRTSDRVGSHPSNWATFVLIGNEAPVAFPGSGRIWWVVLFLLLGIVSVFTYFRRRGLGSLPDPR